MPATGASSLSARQAPPGAPKNGLDPDCRAHPQDLSDQRLDMRPLSAAMSDVPAVARPRLGVRQATRR
jgi:hypothetical protein